MNVSSHPRATRRRRKDWKHLNLLHQICSMHAASGKSPIAEVRPALWSGSTANHAHGGRLATDCGGMSANAVTQLARGTYVAMQLVCAVSEAMSACKGEWTNTDGHCGIPGSRPRLACTDWLLICHKPQSANANQGANQRAWHLPDQSMCLCAGAVVAWSPAG